MMPTLQRWRKRLFASSTPDHTGLSQSHDTGAREHRAQTVSALRDDIRRLQQEITDLSDTLPIDSGTAATPETGRMASLHRELAEAQRKLGTYQARI